MTVVKLIAVDETGQEISLPDSKQIPGWLKKSRKKAGKSLQEVADALDVSKQAVYLWESGTTSPTVDRLVKLMSMFAESAADSGLAKVDALLLPHAQNTAVEKK